MLLPVSMQAIWEGRIYIFATVVLKETGQRRMMIVKVACVDSNKSIFPSQQTYLAKTDV